jgi:hypothetical protein
MSRGSAANTALTTRSNRNPRPRRGAVGQLERLERLGVEASGTGRPPGPIERDRGLELDDLAQECSEVTRVRLGQWRDQTSEVSLGASVVEDLLALGVGLERRHSERARAGEDPVLARSDPLPADLDDLAAADRMVERPAPDPVARFEHDHRVPGLGEVAGGAQPGEARADHDDVRASPRSTPCSACAGELGIGEQRRSRASGATGQDLAPGDSGHRPASTQPRRARSAGNGRSAIRAVGM